MPNTLLWYHRLHIPTGKEELEGIYVSVPEGPDFVARAFAHLLTVVDEWNRRGGAIWKYWGRAEREGVMAKLKAHGPAILQMAKEDDRPMSEFTSWEKVTYSVHEDGVVLRKLDVRFKADGSARSGEFYSYGWKRSHRLFTRNTPWAPGFAKDKVPGFKQALERDGFREVRS